MQPWPQPAFLTWSPVRGRQAFVPAPGMPVRRSVLRKLPALLSAGPQGDCSPWCCVCCFGHITEATHIASVNMCCVSPRSPAVTRWL